jgi:hypothetical protein
MVITKFNHIRLVDRAEQYGKLDDGQCAYHEHSSTAELNIYITCYYTTRHLIRTGVNDGVLKVLSSMHGKMVAKVKTSSALTEVFHSMVGTRQGCTISLLLFVFFSNALISIFD